MKTLYNYILCLLLIYSSGFAQQASGYFPSQTGFTWKYHVTPLDSANNGIDPFAFYRADSFANVDNSRGMLANIVLTKSGSLISLPAQPYDDSLFYHFDGSTAFEYSQVGNEEFLLRTLDSLQIDPNFSFLDFVTSLEDWYSMYRFAQPVNSAYDIFSVDTSLNTGFGTLPIRLEYLGMRLQDENVETQIGTIDSKKFLIVKEVGLILSPTTTLPFVSIEDTLWIAPDKWILKRIVPSTFVDLSLLGVDPLFVPGVKTEIIEFISDVEESAALPTDIYLYQNYPNPFNPTTSIQFAVGSPQNVILKIYDVLGNEVATLVNEEKPVGNYEVEFNATKLSSGIYFYQLRAGNYVETKKMILLK